MAGVPAHCLPRPLDLPEGSSISHHFPGLLSAQQAPGGWRTGGPSIPHPESSPYTFTTKEKFTRHFGTDSNRRISEPMLW